MVVPNYFARIKATQKSNSQKHSNYAEMLAVRLMMNRKNKERNEVEE